MAASRKSGSAKPGVPAAPEMPRLKVHELATRSPAAGTSGIEMESEKLHEIARLLYLPKSLSPQAQMTRIERALELYESIEPQDGTEGMLAVQMVGTHFAALDCLRRAALVDQSLEARDVLLRHASRLMTLYTQQLAALDKHRGKGQQRVTVEHVHVAPGGQAIVGTVETARSAKALPSDEAQDVPFAIRPRSPRRKSGGASE